LHDSLDEDDDEDGLTGRTSLLGHAAGWTIFENLYLYNGTLYVITCVRQTCSSAAIKTLTIRATICTRHRAVIGGMITQSCVS
jgi:hypothetical protein